MKITLTGSLGNIGRPLAEELIRDGHEITIVSSNANNQKLIERLGANAAIGSLEDEAFVVQTFIDADAAFCMIPPNFSAPDQIAYYEQIGRSYAEAIKKTNVKRIVHLSSWGAHLEKGTGFIVGSHRVEEILNVLPNVLLTHIRPGSFYYNLLSFIPVIKATGAIQCNYGGDDKLSMVSPKDIASNVAEQLTSAHDKVRYVVSDESSCNEIAKVLGTAIGKPNMEWQLISNDQMKKELEYAGLPPHVVGNLLELNEAIHTGLLREDYDKHQLITGKVKLEEFAREFADAFAKD